LKTKTSYISIIFCSFILLLNGCRKIEFKYPDRLEGEWKIVKSERAIINQDGSLDYFENLENSGNLSVFEADPPAETFKEFIFNFTNYLGDSGSFRSFIYTDEGGSRIFFSQVLCNSPFECDLVWTVEENKRNRQVWAAYGTLDGYFYPPDRYDPSNDSGHLVWRITLEKE